MVLSVLVAMILTPALCATILKPIAPGHHEKGGFFGWFNRNFDRSSHGYSRVVGWILGRRGRSFAIYAVIVAVMALLYTRIPTSFLPDEDQGIMYVQVQTPPGDRKSTRLNSSH